MTRKFVMLPEFDKNWASMGLDDNDLRRLQEELLFNPEKGDVMQGTGGLQKRQRTCLLCGFCGLREHLPYNRIS